MPQGAKICEKLPVLPSGRLRQGVLMDIPGLNEAWEACEVCLPEYKNTSQVAPGEAVREPAKCPACLGG